MKPADIMAVMMISTICLVIVGIYMKAWITGVDIALDRIQIIENLFTGMLALVAYRMGRGDY